MNSSGRRRGFSSWFVEPHRQVKLGLLFILLNFTFSFIILATFSYYFWDVYSAISVYFRLSSEQSAEVLAKFFPPLYIAASLIFLFILASILISVRFTHRIYGPLVSIHRFLDDFLEGRNVSPLTLRESDQLQMLAERLNELLIRFPLERRQSSMGPVYKFLDQLIAGEEPKPLNIRGDDQLSYLCKKLNKLAEKPDS